MVKREMSRFSSRNNIWECWRIDRWRFTFSYFISSIRWSSIRWTFRKRSRQTINERTMFVYRNISFSILVFSLLFSASINCLHADGAKFVHPLQHLGKSQSDLPILAIDSFRHMFLFPDFNEMSYVVHRFHFELLFIAVRLIVFLLEKTANCYNSLKIFIQKNFIKNFTILLQQQQQAKLRQFVEKIF